MVLCALFSFVFAFTLTFHTCYVRIYPNETTWSNKKQQKCHNKKTDKTRKYYLEQLDSWHIYSALWLFFILTHGWKDKPTHAIKYALKTTWLPTKVWALHFEKNTHSTAQHRTAQHSTHLKIQCWLTFRTFQWEFTSKNFLLSLNFTYSSKEVTDIFINIDWRFELVFLATSSRSSFSSLFHSVDSWLKLLFMYILLTFFSCSFFYYSFIHQNQHHIEVNVNCLDRMYRWIVHLHRHRQLAQQTRDEIHKYVHSIFMAILLRKFAIKLRSILFDNFPFLITVLIVVCVMCTVLDLYSIDIIWLYVLRMLFIGFHLRLFAWTNSIFE